MDLIITILPVVTKDLPISPRFTPYNFLSRCKFSTLTTRQPMVELDIHIFLCLSSAVLALIFYREKDGDLANGSPARGRVRFEY